MSPLGSNTLTMPVSKKIIEQRIIYLHCRTHPACCFCDIFHVVISLLGASTWLSLTCHRVRFCENNQLVLTTFYFTLLYLETVELIHTIST